jgi:Arc/MetJ-type ribon-helix-helix transcriptional regulator
VGNRYVYVDAYLSRHVTLVSDESAQQFEFLQSQSHGADPDFSCITICITVIFYSMADPMTLRLNDETRQRIRRIARRRRVSVSDVIRQAIDSWVEQQEPVGSPYELMADLIGVVHGGNPRRSSGTGRRFRELLQDRRKRP